MKILFVSSEVAPFAKTGGLGDVAAALPRHLAARGHELLVCVPFYRRVRDGGFALEGLEELGAIPVELGPRRFTFRVVRGVLPKSRQPVHFIDCPDAYDRDGIYTADGDEHLRFLLLSHASLLLCQRLGFSPDIVHANDWQSAILPLLLKTRFAWDEARFGATRSVLTIHNLLHQGMFGRHAVADAGLTDASHLFHQEQLDAGVVNLLLTGILYADAVTTVSPGYAREIQGPEQGAGLDGFLRQRAATVVGILNGIDESEWNPSIDPHIARRYDRDTLGDKEWNKKALLEAMGLPHDPRVPVLGLVSRLAWQKGIDLVLDALPPILARRRVQFVALGSGATSYEHGLAALQRRFPRQVCFYRGYSNPLAHMIEAGADMFLMPSRYEPCGLNQMYSMRYGTVPIVRATGGLADSVAPYGQDPPRGTGFVFEHFSVAGLRWAIDRALALWPNRPAWRRLQERAMRVDSSWEGRIGHYETLYERVMEL